MLIMNKIKSIIMARLGPTGLTQVFVEIKNWVVSKLSSKANDSDVVHKSEDETIDGNKTFGSLFTKSSGPSIWMKNNSFVMGTAPATNRYTGLWIKDTNDNDVAYIVHQANKNNSQNIRLLVSNTDGVNIYQTALTFQSTINGEFNFYPDADNVVNLGKATNKWTNVYATNFTGDLVGNATSATKATQDASGNVITDTYATKLYVDNEISGIVNSAPATLDTLNELASALGDDPNFATTMATQIGTKANDSDVVHTSGNETIDGNKFFSKTIRRTADITTSAAEEVYKFTDTNATPCGSIYNRMYWVSNKVFNRHHAYNATSGKDMYVEVVSDNDGSGVINTGGSVTDNRNLTTVTAGTGSTYVATMGWVNNPETSTNVVHRSGDETIVGTKTFSSNIVGNISGSSTSCTGNSVSATKLATGRTINIQDSDGTNTGTAVTFNGTTNGVIKLPATIKATITGNASTATQVSANKSVTLTGDVTGTASSNAGWSVATTLANSGATAGTYGPTADVTGNNNATIVVPQITVDAKGRVTAVTTKTLTCKNNTYTVNDATLTIQKNGTTVKTFTANASSNVTANITVPTKVSELTNDSGFLTSHQTVTNSAPTLAWGTTSTIGGVGGTNLTVKMPANPNTDTLMTQNVSTTAATYPILLCPTANATANQGAKSGLFASAVKVNPSTGMVTASGFTGDVTGNVTGNCSGTAGNVAWANVSGKPSTYTPSSHTHDDRYYTESEIYTKLSSKSNTGHTHDDRYYTETEVNNLLSGKANTSGTYSNLTVGNATKATQDASGNVISTTYGKLTSENTWARNNTFKSNVIINDGEYDYTQTPTINYT